MSDLPEGKVALKINDQMIMVDDSGDPLNNQERLIALAIEKGLIEINDQAEMMKSQAASFANVAIRLYEENIRNMKRDDRSSMQKVKDVISPYAVNISFSIEMYLKCLKMKYAQHLFKHELIILYDDLPDELKPKIDEKTIEVEEEWGISERKVFREYLRYLDNAFVQWRYIHHYGLQHIDFVDAMLALRVIADVAAVEVNA